MPHVTGCAFVGSGAGTAWLTSDGYTALFDGKPARRARMQWRNDTTPSTSHAVIVSATFAQSFKPRVVALLGLSCDTGVRIEVRNGDASVLGGNALNVRTTRLPDGSVGAWVVLDGTVSTSQVQFRIFNDRDGATWATSATTLDIGEFVVMPAIEIEHQPDWSEEVVDPTEAQLTRAAQMVSARRQAYRRLEAILTADAGAKVRGGGLANGMDWHQLRLALLGDRRMCALPRWKTAAGAVDGAEAHRTGVYGVGRLGATGHLGGDYYGASITVQEVPALS